MHWYVPFSCSTCVRRWWSLFSLPVGILIAFIVMYAQGINANIMSLGGIAIAIGAMVDAAIVMIENVHKHMEHREVTAANRWEIMAEAAAEVGPALFFSLLIITLSFLPVFTLEAQEGRLFSPLAFTKTYAMAGAAVLSITLVPVLMGYFIRGKIIAEDKKPDEPGVDCAVSTGNQLGMTMPEDRGPGMQCWRPHPWSGH